MGLNVKAFSTLTLDEALLINFSSIDLQSDEIFCSNSLQKNYKIKNFMIFVEIDFMSKINEIFKLP